MTYIPQVGDRVIVDFEDLGLSVERIHEVSPDGSWILLFQHEAGEQLATADWKGLWRLQESGNKVFLLDPQQDPERGGIGFVIDNVDGPVEEWAMEAPSEKFPDSAEGFLHSEQVSDFAHRQEDGSWKISAAAEEEERPEVQIFFITEKQASFRLNYHGEADQQQPPAPASGDKFRTVSDGTVEFWDYAGQTPDGETLIRRNVEDAEYIRHLEPTKDELERTPADWRCLDDPDEFETIIHMPRIAGAEGPEVGDICTRVIGGTSLMYRIRDFEQFGELRIAQLTLAPDVLGFYPYDQVSYVPDGGWQWPNGDKATFTSGRPDELARRATRLDTVHKVLREKYFEYAELADDPSWAVAIAIRDEYEELLFLAETGFRPDQAPQRYEEFCENLHEEYLSSREG